MSARRAIITGIGGQDGSYLAEQLLGRGYEVVGLVRRPDAVYDNLASVQERVELVQAELLHEDALIAVLRAHAPHEVYNSPPRRSYRCRGGSRWRRPRSRRSG